MTSADSAAALRRVIEVLDGVDARYAVVGSAAAASWGVVRSTRDVDVVAVVDASTADAAVDALHAADLYVPLDAAAVLRAGGSFNIIDAAGGGKVDVFVVDCSDSFELMRLERRVRMEVLGVDTWVAAAEDIVLAKLRWRRDSRSEQQWRDCVEIVASNQVDRSHLREWAAVLGVVDDLEALLREVDNSMGTH